MKAVGYIRVSTAGQAKEGVSLESQEERIRGWATFNKAEEVFFFRDEGVSGRRAKNRPGLQAALASVGKGDALVVYSLSRLSRSIRDTLNISERLQKTGADLVSLSESIDTTTAAGKMVFRLLAVFAEYQSDVIGEGVAEAWQYNRRKGKKTGGDVPFGYRVRSGKLYEDRAEQETVRMILGLREKGESLRTICATLEAAGIRRKSGIATWHPNAVCRIIQRVERDEAEREVQKVRVAA